MSEYNGNAEGHVPFDQAGLARIVRARAKKHLNVVMRYFWASFALQLLAYALLSHVIIKYGSDLQTLLAGLAGVILFISLYHCTYSKVQYHGGCPHTRRKFGRIHS